MLVDFINKGSVQVARLQEERLDARVALDLKEALTPTVDRGTKKLVINFAKTTFIDSSALGVIVGVLKHMGGGGNIVISNANGPVSSAFKLTRMDKIIRLFSTEEEAVAAISSDN